MPLPTTTSSKAREPANGRRPKVLLIAEAANPEWTSVPLVGWSHAQALCKLVDGHIVTQVRNRDAFIRHGMIEGDQFTAIDSEAVARQMWRVSSILRGGSGKGWTTLTALAPISYYYFEYRVWKHFGEAIRSGQYDIVHRITPLSPTTPSILAGRCHRHGVPFVVGPLNGGVPWPQWFDSERKREREWMVPLRRAYRLLPGATSTIRDSAALIVGSRHTESEIPFRYHDKVHYLPENAIDPMRFSEPAPRIYERPLKLLFVGRLVPYKGCDMVIEAARGLLENGTAKLTIVGDGPDRTRLEEMARGSVAAGTVNFVGQVSHSQVEGYFASSDVFAFPSIREFGGAVVLEAMAMGCVPVVVNYGGPAELVTPDCSYTLKVGPRESIVEGLRKQLSELAGDIAQLAAKSSKAVQIARQQFTWYQKAMAVTRIYDSVLGRD